jgi:heme-degrading monooxygenase HmoA
MYGTVAKMRLTPGAEPLFMAMFEAFQAEPHEGWISSMLFRTDADPLQLYLVVLFESKESYHLNAERPNQHAQYVRMRAALEADPEWNDGEVIGIMPERAAP